MDLIDYTTNDVNSFIWIKYFVYWEARGTTKKSYVQKEYVQGSQWGVHKYLR